MFEDSLDWLVFSCACLGVIAENFVSDLDLANRLLAIVGGDFGVGTETTGIRFRLETSEGVDTGNRAEHSSGYHCQAAIPDDAACRDPLIPRPAIEGVARSCRSYSRCDAGGSRHTDPIGSGTYS